MATGTSVRPDHSKKWLWLLSVIALAVYCWFRNDPAPATPARSLDERLAALEREQSALNARLDRALAPLAARQHRRAQAGSEAVLAAEAAPSMPVEPERQMADQAAYFEQLFRRDRADLVWASRTETAAMAVIGTSDSTRLGKPLSQDIDCRGSMCRLSFIFESGMTASDWESYLPLHLGQTLSALRAMTLPLPDGRVELRLYGFRGGEEALHRATAGFSS